jgi:hypothetical protein
MEKARAFETLINIVECRVVAMQRPRDGGYTKVISVQRLGKHVLVVRQQILNNTTA